jgi:hypothetical protein
LDKDLVGSKGRLDLEKAIVLNGCLDHVLAPVGSTQRVCVIAA